MFKQMILLVLFVLLPHRHKELKFKTILGLPHSNIVKAHRTHSLLS